MDFLQAVFIGIVHGITVFLPVSSSGHTSLIGNLWNIDGAQGLFLKCCCTRLRWLRFCLLFGGMS